MIYKDYLNSKDWKEKRAIKLRNKKYCSVCGIKEKIDIHHLQYKNLFDVNSRDLLRLCRTCHFTFHELLKKGVVKFKGKSISIIELRKRPYFGQVAIIKLAIKKARGLGTWNQSNHFIPTNCFKT
mgnify:CR=1 FL=1